MLEVRNLEAGYGELRVLKGVSLHVRAGEIVAIIGANGAGKTTLLGAVAGVVRVRAGAIRFDGRDCRGLRAEQMAVAGCSLVPEGRQVFAPMTVLENLEVGAAALRGRGDRTPSSGVLAEVLPLFPRLAERRHQLAGTLSGGEQQMLAIARALMARPRLMMLDEPSMGLAPLIVKGIFEAIVRLRAGGKTILLVEQNARTALAVADRGYVLETGRIMLQGSAEELLDNQEVQRAYLGKDYDRINE
jgi:branched-chain amino acid transport system ATP-binding protein